MAHLHCDTNTRYLPLASSTCSHYTITPLAIHPCAKSTGGSCLSSNTGWSAVLIEYNSWDSNITVKGNWVEGTGIPWDLPLHTLNPETFSAGWGHGILIEDSSMVTVIDNRILGAAETGIEVVNAQNIVLKNNGISSTGTGIGVRRYNESSLQREYSPLQPGNAGSAIVSVSGNNFLETKEDYYVDEFSELIHLDER
jgi:parallel beta-helix repeat protein